MLYAQIVPYSPRIILFLIWNKGLNPFWIQTLKNMSQADKHSGYSGHNSSVKSFLVTCIWVCLIAFSQDETVSYWNKSVIMFFGIISIVIWPVPWLITQDEFGYIPLARELKELNRDIWVELEILETRESDVYVFNLASKND